MPSLPTKATLERFTDIQLGPWPVAHSSHDGIYTSPPQEKKSATCSGKPHVGCCGECLHLLIIQPSRGGSRS